MTEARDRVIMPSKDHVSIKVKAVLSNSSRSQAPVLHALQFF